MLKGTIRSGHISCMPQILDADNMMIYEAKGLNYGVVRSKFKKGSWAFGLLFSDMAYVNNPVLKSKNPYDEPVKELSRGMKGDGVKWVQFELHEFGFNIEIDGIFGPKTKAAVVQFQSSCKVEADGIVGPVTRSLLKEK